MVKPKSEPEPRDLVRDSIKRINEDYPIVDTRWFVVEHLPSYRYDDEYDCHWTKPVNKIVSPYFSTEKEAEDWQEEHLPDDGKRLIVKKQHKRRFVTERWMGY